MRKTNLEELNYRFRKKLLNNYGYKLYYELVAMIVEAKVTPEFNYSAWVKGLFKTDGDDDSTLVEFLESCNVYLFKDPNDWFNEYARGDDGVDVLDMEYACKMWVQLDSEIIMQRLRRHPKKWEVFMGYIANDDGYFISDEKIKDWKIKFKYK